ncbi:SDR family NAD(P)-dependent oxidoreductase [Nocardia sp. NPDC051570]|uniref:SDR family NAD(P)-dependent oxidoreductase n=1 Tax=Nocardia sp. NPDC051570 TaxID=3364324 RepID=UPI003788F43B
MAHNGTALIIGVGPGLGISMAHRLGHEGFRVVLVSRNKTRHPTYLAALAAAGIEATAHAVDVTDTEAFGRVLKHIDTVDLAYYGPGPTDQQIVPITEIDIPTAQSAFSWVWPAVRLAEAVLPGMIERGSGAFLLAGGLSSVRPMPALGQLALASAALRNYALTLHAELADKGVYAGTLTIGGVVERGDIHAMVTADPAKYGAAEGHTLDPDRIAETAWEMCRTRERAEVVFDAL